MAARQAAPALISGQVQQRILRYHFSCTFRERVVSLYYYPIFPRVLTLSELTSWSHRSHKEINDGIDLFLAKAPLTAQVAY
jgi:hypothetical protein